MKAKCEFRPDAAMGIEIIFHFPEPEEIDEGSRPVLYLWLEDNYKCTNKNRTNEACQCCEGVSLEMDFFRLLIETIDGECDPPYRAEFADIIAERLEGWDEDLRSNYPKPHI